MYYAAEVKRGREPVQCLLRDFNARVPFSAVVDRSVCVIQPLRSNPCPVSGGPLGKLGISGCCISVCRKVRARVRACICHACNARHESANRRIRLVLLACIALDVTFFIPPLAVYMPPTHHQCQKRWCAFPKSRVLPVLLGNNIARPCSPGSRQGAAFCLSVACVGVVVAALVHPESLVP